MIGVVATVQVQQERAAEFERVALKLEGWVKANEPGCLLYRMTPSRTEPNTTRASSSTVTRPPSIFTWRATISRPRWGECPPASAGPRTSTSWTPWKIDRVGRDSPQGAGRRVRQATEAASQPRVNASCARRPPADACA